jgi:hypothetical protein
VQHLLPFLQQKMRARNVFRLNDEQLGMCPFKNESCTCVHMLYSSTYLVLEAPGAFMCLLVVLREGCKALGV